MSAPNEIAIVRTFDAPRELVWEVWTKPEHIGQWWGPRGFTNTTEQMDVRPGGTWRVIMHGPDGRDYPNEITYLELDPPARLVYSQGGIGPTMRVTVLFNDLGGRTELDMCMVFATVEDRNLVAEKFGAVEGLTQCMDRLGEHLAALA